jgi:hypothetical protein
MCESLESLVQSFEEIFDGFVANPPTPDADQGNTTVGWRLHNVILERGARVVPVFHTVSMYASGQYYFGKSTIKLEGSEYTLAALIDRHTADCRCGFVGDVQPFMGEGRFFSNTINENRRPQAVILGDYPESVAYGTAPVVLSKPPHRPMASMIPMSDTHIGLDPSPYFGEILSNIKAAVRGTMQEFTRHAKKMKAPHQHRPELRGSGIPRKRGKGRA